MTITIVGLGPGSPDLLTREAWVALSEADEVYLRTARHPTVGGLPELRAGLVVEILGPKPLRAGAQPRDDVAGDTERYRTSAAAVGEPSCK